MNILEIVLDQGGRQRQRSKTKSLLSVRYSEIALEGKKPVLIFAGGLSKETHKKGRKGRY
jgi:hypothetical protein